MQITLGWWVVPFVVWMLVCLSVAEPSDYRECFALGLVGWAFMAAARWL